MKQQIVYMLLYGLGFNLVYFILFSQPLYRTGYFINLYYPGALLFGIGGFLLLNGLFWKLERGWCWTAVGCFVVLVFLIPFVIKCCFGNTLRDFYVRGYENLLHLMEYYKDVHR